MEPLDINGWKVLVCNNHNPITNIRYVRNVGASLEDDDTKYGISHFIEHMFFKGTKYKTYKEFNKYTSKLGRINAYTSFAQTVYHMTSLSNKFKDAFNILDEMMSCPLFPEEEMELERGVILEELNTSNNDPTSYFYKTLLEDAYGKQGHAILGTTESLHTISIDDISSFVSKFYNPNNTLISVTGGVKEKKVIKSLSKILNKVYDGSKINNNINKPTLNMNDCYFEHNKSSQTILSLSYPSPINIKSDVDTRIILGILLNGLGGGMHSLLFDRVREELGMCYSIHSFDFDICDVNTVHIQCNLSSKNVNVVKDEIINIINNLKTFGFTESLLDVAKESQKFRYANSYNNSSLLNTAMADNYFRSRNSFIDFDKACDIIDDVKNDDIINTSNGVFNNAKFTLMNG